MPDSIPAAQDAERLGMSKVEHALACAVFAETVEHWADIKRLVREGVSEERTIVLKDAYSRAERAWTDTLDDCHDLRQAGMNAIEAIRLPALRSLSQETKDAE